MVGHARTHDAAADDDDLGTRWHLGHGLTLDNDRPGGGNKECLEQAHDLAIDEVNAFT